MRRRELTGYLKEGGPGLPRASRKDSLKKEYMERAGALERIEVAAPVARPAVAGRAGWRPLPALAKVAVVAVAVVALLVGTGIGSAYAMPGNPLYSVKRLLEGARLSLSQSGESKATEYLAFANRRIDELEYTSDRKMESWYLSLAGGAQDRIDATYGQAKRIRGSGQALKLEAARKAELRLEVLLGKIIPKVSGAEKGDLERVRTRARERLGPAGGQTGPGPGGTQGPGQQNQQGQQQGPSDGQQQGPSDSGQVQQQGPSDSGQSQQRAPSDSQQLQPQLFPFGTQLQQQSPVEDGHVQQHGVLL